MELNAEINKIVGEELSKILIEKIDNDELERMAMDSYELIIRIISRAKEKIIESVSSRIAILSVGYEGLNMESMINDAIRMEFTKRQ